MPTPPGVRRVMTAVMIPLAAVTLIAVVVLWPAGGPRAEADPVVRHGATVTEVHEQPCPEPDDTPAGQAGVIRQRCGTVTVRVADGPDAGQEVTTQMPNGPGAPTVRVGDEVVLVTLFDPANPDITQYAVADHQRGNPLLLLALLFAAAIVGFGRWRGMAALTGLAACFTIVLTFVLPAIIDGRPPLLVAVVGAAAIMFVVLYLVHGVSVQTSVAALGTLAALILTGVLGAAATSITHLTGFGSEEAGMVAVFHQSIDLRGLLLAGIIIGSLGVLDDITVTQAATVAEVARANPTLSRRQLYLAGTRVGRAHIASVVNTIVLAYAGASLPLLVLIVAGGQSTGTVLTSEFIAQEIVRSVVATIGLVAAVPLTTGLAAVVCGAPAAEPAPPPVPGRRGAHEWNGATDPARAAADHGRWSADPPADQAGFSSW
jgi:uncharacterized membrane protein